MLVASQESSQTETGGRCWRLWDDGVVGTASEGLALDCEMITHVVANAWPPTARLWTAKQAVVITGRERRLPGFARAAERLQMQGWPVVVRMTGGSAFPIGPDVLNLSLAFRRTGMDTIDSVYRFLCAPIQTALAELDIKTEFGRRHGAFCEGDSDLLFKGLKVVGTAQCWKAGGGILAHAAILVVGDLRAASDAVNRFHLWSGETARAMPGTAISVASALGMPNDGSKGDLLRHLRSCLRQSLSQSFTIKQDGTVRPCNPPAP